MTNETIFVKVAEGFLSDLVFFIAYLMIFKDLQAI